MKPNVRLLFGPLATAIFVVGLLCLPRMVPAYSQVHQTVSEIGELGSPARIPFTLMLCAVALCILVFAYALRELSLKAGRSAAPAYLSGCLAVSCVGVAIFAFPHPLHNWFGLSELVGYQAPLAMALAWRREPRVGGVVAFSWIMYAVTCAAIVANLSVLDRTGALWALERPVYGLVQRSLFLVWFVWCAGVGFALYGASGKAWGPRFASSGY
jgi:hypothetical membrane protein